MIKVTKNPAELGVHPLLKTQPWMSEDDMNRLVESVREHGVLQDIFITEGDEVVDGRHRWKAACLAGKSEITCQVVPEDQISSIILATILDRRHYTKSARAYLSLPLLEKAVSEGIQRRAEQLRVGSKSPKSDSVTFRGKPGSEELADRLGISVDMMKLARNTERLFAESDARVKAWLEANPDLQISWLEFQDAHPTAHLSWASWRTVTLKEDGHNPLDPKSVNIIPEDYREAYEDLLFTGEMGLGQINKAVGSALVTKGEGRSDLSKGNPALHITLGNKLKSFTTTMFGTWKELPFESRIELCGKVAESATEWPDEVQRATFAKLKEMFAK